MIRYALVFCLLVAGCGGPGSGGLSQESLDQLKEGMALQEVESVLGTDSSVIWNNEGSSAYEWSKGKGAKIRSIVVNF